MTRPDDPDEHSLEFDLLDPRHKAVNDAFFKAYKKATRDSDFSEMDFATLALSYASSLCVFMGMHPSTVGAFAEDLANGHAEIRPAPTARLTIKSLDYEIERKRI